MSRSLTRRGFLMLGAVLPALFRGTAASAGDASKDQGIGGTGWSAGTDGDQGIGGTGIVGTIQRFGSIFVNGVRVGYSPDVPVWIDGDRVTASSLKIGQVVRVAVVRDKGRTVTHAIHVTSEVVGPVERATAGSISVLGQQVDITRIAKGVKIKAGDIVAVSGIRRPGGKIVASLVETRPGETHYLVRGLAVAKSGTLLVGRLKIGSKSSRLAGQRVEVALVRVKDGYKVLHLAAEAPVPHSHVGGVLYETFLQRQGRRLESGLGIALDDHSDEPGSAGVVRAFLDVRFDRGGHIVSASRQANAGSRSPDQPGMPSQQPAVQTQPAGSVPAEVTGPTVPDNPGDLGPGNVNPGGLTSPRSATPGRVGNVGGATPGGVGNFGGANQGGGGGGLGGKSTGGAGVF